MSELIERIDFCLKYDELPTVARQTFEQCKAALSQQAELISVLESTIQAGMRIDAKVAQQEAEPWKSSGADYDRDIHANPDAAAWADFFLATFPNCGADRDLMIGWFANAMMAMCDHIKNKEQQEAEPVAFDDWPEYHEQGMGCGLEDRGITDRYEAMRYGWDEAIDRVAESFAQFETPKPAPLPDVIFGEGYQKARDDLAGTVPRQWYEAMEAIVAQCEDLFTAHKDERERDGWDSPKEPQSLIAARRMIQEYTPLPQPTKGICNDERACPACYSGQGKCTNSSQLIGDCKNQDCDRLAPEGMYCEVCAEVAQSVAPLPQRGRKWSECDHGVNFTSYCEQCGTESAAGLPPQTQPDDTWESGCGCRFENDHSSAVVLCDECRDLPCHNQGGVVTQQVASVPQDDYVASLEFRIGQFIVGDCTCPPNDQVRRATETEDGVVHFPGCPMINKIKLARLQAVPQDVEEWLSKHSFSARTFGASEVVIDSDDLRTWMAGHARVLVDEIVDYGGAFAEGRASAYGRLTEEQLLLISRMVEGYESLLRDHNDKRGEGGWDLVEVDSAFREAVAMLAASQQEGV